MPVPDPSDASAAMALDVADLTALPELDEASILAALETRFARRAVYTNTGAILLAVNPFEKLQGLYDRAALGEYLQSFETRASSIRAGTKRLPPHIYQVAGEAFRAMVRGGGDQETARPDQAILVSGESGSGKTESTKFLLEYLAQAGDAAPAALAQTLRSQRGIAAKVLQTNILLESFGNARTLRNDNSSRFGKFIKLHFTPGGRLTGASIQTYLLEKVRLVSQSHGERNYHVFYEMSLGASAAARQRWMLDPPPGSVSNDTHSAMAAGEDASTDMAGQFRYYRYLNQSGCFQRRDGVADVAMFRRVMDAMEVVGFTPFERAGVFDLLAALMHIGNLAFQHDEGSDRLGFSQSGSSSSRTDLMPSCLWSRDAAAKLLAVDARELERALSVRRIRAGTDFVSVKLSAEQANNARDALAKALYGRLFEWMVSRMNEFLKMDADALRGGRSHFIGILDIFGFEVFPTNSFEQLCINYANETLQQQFNEYVFKLEQREYEAQGVEWKYVAFLDNQDCVQLIAQRPTGLLSLIDEECVMPKGSDATLASKLYRACDGHARFQASRIQKARGQFTVVHYAGPVEYSSAGFLDKNKDVLHQEAVDLLAFSTKDGSFTRTLCEALSTPAAARARAKSSPRQRAQTSKHRGASVGLQFKEQLTTLLETLERTRPHYVRCLKPNDQCEARAFDRARVLDQLRCSGVMEAVRVSRAGYPVRLPLDLFVGRYWPLQRGAATHPLRQLKADPAAAIDPAAAASTHARALLRELLPKLPRDPVVTQQPRQTAHEPQGEFAQQCVAVGVQVGHTKLFLKKASHEALEELRAQRLHGHMLRIARAMVGFAARARFLRVRRAVVAVQRRFRTKRCGRHGRAARVVQRAMRGAAQRRKYRRVLLAVRVVQCRFRWRAHRRRVLQERERERERQRRQREAEDAKRRQLAAKQRERQRELEAQQRALQLQVPPPAPIDTGSGTASDSSSSPAKSELSPTSQTSNDVEGSASSGYSSDEYYGGGGGAGHKGFGGGLTPVDEGMAAVGRASRRFPNGRRPSTIDTLGPLAASTPRRSRARPPFGQGPHGQSQPQLIGHGGHSLARKSSFRSTRSSRAVALPRLDVVQETQWVNDEDRFSCHICNKRFSMFKRKHHCRACGEVICNSCSLYHRIQSRSMRVCVSCVAFHSLESPTHAAALASAASSARSGSGASSRKISNGSSQPTTDRARSSTQSSGLWLNAWPEPPYPEDEEERLTVLRELNVRELAGSGRFNMYCEVAAKTMKCPIAYVSIIDEEEQLLVANIGMAHATLPRELSFCAHTICQPSVLVVLDTKLDERFRDNPMVKGDKGAVKIRYYAGATIFSKDGHALGTVAVLDTKPRREADQEHIGMLQHLSFLASEKMAQSAAHEDSDSEYL